jgi:hypothetical protein
MDSPTGWAVRKILDNFMVKFLSIFHNAVASMFKVPLILTLIIKPEGCFLSVPVLTLPFIPDTIQFLLPLYIDVS